MRNYNFLILLLFIFLVSNSSVFAGGIPNAAINANDEAVIVLPENDPADTKFPKGSKIYKEKCIICHMANGEGISGAFPPLKNSDYLFADKLRAVGHILNGSQTEMVVNGVTYTAPMTTQIDAKEDAVAVINYVLNAWGNKGGIISLEDVKELKVNP